MRDILELENCNQRKYMARIGIDEGKMKELHECHEQKRRKLKGLNRGSIVARDKLVGAINRSRETVLTEAEVNEVKENLEEFLLIQAELRAVSFEKRVGFGALLWAPTTAELQGKDSASQPA